MSLALIPLAAFLAVATVQDVWNHTVERWTFVLALAALFAGWATGLWPLYVGGCLLGFGLVWLAGAPTGDRFGAAVAGLVLGEPVAAAVIVACAGAFLWWSRWGSYRSPADFAFFPFLSIGVGGTVVYQLIDLFRV